MLFSKSDALRIIWTFLWPIFLVSTKPNSRKRVKPSTSNAVSASSGESENDDPNSKKRKLDVQGLPSGLDALMRQQNDALHELRGQIEKHIGDICSKEILRRNGQYVPRDKNEVIEISF